MSKKEIIDAMADAAEITKDKAGAALDALTGYIEGTLKSGEEVNFAPLDTKMPRKTVLRGIQATSLFT